MSVVDKELPFALIDLVVSVVQALMGAIFMCLASGYFALTMPPLAAIMWGKLCLNPSADSLQWPAS